MYPCDGELLVQELTGIPVIWEPLRRDGTTKFNDHPSGEGYSLNQDTPLDRRLGCFVRIPITDKEALSFFRDDDNPKEDSPHPKQRVAIKRFRPDAIPLFRNTRTNILKQRILEAPDAFKPTTFIENLSLQAILDTLQNSILTVGDLFTYGTISAGNAAANSGDCVEVHEGGVANVYTEVFTITKAIQLIGAVAEQGITIASGSNACLYISGGTTYTGLIKNFKLTPTVYAMYGLYIGTAYNWSIIDIVTIGAPSLVGLRFSNQQPGHTFLNCVASAYNDGFRYVSTDSHHRFIHCSAISNANRGFYDSSSYGHYEHCIAVGNLGGDFSNTSTRTMLNVSGDSSAPGYGSVTGLLLSDFENIWHIKDSVKNTTLAKLFGYPRDVTTDARGQIRKQAGVMYAGAYDPDPDVFLGSIDSESRVGTTKLISGVR